MRTKGRTVAYTAEEIRRLRARGEDRTDWDALDRMSEADGTMRLEDFRIGGEFLCGGRRWRCTDVGTRVVVAVCLDDHPDDPSWYNGPPYQPVDEVLYPSACTNILRPKPSDTYKMWYAVRRTTTSSTGCYAVAESVFDEYDQKGCEPAEGEAAP